MNRFTPKAKYDSVVQLIKQRIKYTVFNDVNLKLSQRSYFMNTRLQLLLFPIVGYNEHCYRYIRYPISTKNSHEEICKVFHICPGWHL